MVSHNNLPVLTGAVGIALMVCLLQWFPILAVVVGFFTFIAVLYQICRDRRAHKLEAMLKKNPIGKCRYTVCIETKQYKFPETPEELLKAIHDKTAYDHFEQYQQEEHDVTDKLLLCPNSDYFIRIQIQLRRYVEFDAVNLCFITECESEGAVRKDNPNRPRIIMLEDANLRYSGKGKSTDDLQNGQDYVYSTYRSEKDAPLTYIAVLKTDDIFEGYLSLRFEFKEIGRRCVRIPLSWEANQG